jgi:hypothetical protein
VSRLLALAAATVVVCACATTAAASRHMYIGINDEPQTLQGNPQIGFPILKQLRARVLRINLYWGGRFGVAREKPAKATDPNDPAYDWEAYDRTIQYARQYGIKMVLSIFGTPGWANGGKGLTVAPRNPQDLERFAVAAARRYSGTFPGPDGRNLPPVRMWTAWNEPNNPIGLKVQYRRVAGRWVVQSAIDYARICNAVYNGVHGTLLRGELVACGVTSPRGNNQPRSIRPAVAPITFLRAAYKAHMRRFDVYAHHPYSGSPAESPSATPSPTAITLANIDVLIREVRRLYGPKRLWITEYGYQTNPPDRTFGVSYTKQALYLKQAYAIARQNPTIDMMLWFLLRDEPSVSNGWQSGLLTFGWKRKPAFYAFQNLPR